MGFFDGLRKRGRPREHFTLEESEQILKETLGRMVHCNVSWPSHRQLEDTVFCIQVEFLSLYSLEVMLKHKHIRDVYFTPQPLEPDKLLLKLVYR